MGLHDGGPKHKSKKAGDAEGKGGPWKVRVSIGLSYECVCST